MMTDLAEAQVAEPGGAMPSPATIMAQSRVTAPGSGRATARAMLDAALSGVELTETDRRFLCRLSQWDKRSATTVASLLARARQRGHLDAIADPGQPV